MRIQHNIAAMNSYRNYMNNTGALSKNLEKLSSGYKINRAGDDAAGLAISEKMRAQITGLDAAQKNVQDGISLVKTAEGAMQEIHDMLNRMVNLATQSANGTYDDLTDRANLQKEVSSLKAEIDRIADSSNFNGIKLLNGDQTIMTDVDFQQATASSITASITVTFATKDANGSAYKGDKLDGMSVQVGGKTYTVKWDVSDDAVDKNLENGVITVKNSTTTLKDVLDKIVTDVNGDKVKVKNTSGEDVELTMSVTASTIVMKGDTAGEKLDFSTMPTISIHSGMKLQIGDTANNYNQMRVNIGDMHTKMLFGGEEVDVSTQKDATTAIDYIKYAINTVSSTRGDLGAIQNRLEHTANNLSVMEENIQNAESAIRDTDVADEMTKYTKNNILIQSAQAMLAQANQMPQGVLQLLQ